MNVRILKLVPLPLLIVATALFAGCKKEANPPASPGSGPSASRSTSPGSGGGIVSAEKNSFDKVAAKLDQGGNFYLYLSTEQALSSLSKNIANLSNVFSQIPIGQALGGARIDRIFEVINNVVKDSGVEQISGFGASSIAREKGFYYNKMILHHYEGQGNGLLWSALGKAPHALKELDLLPETTALAAYADVDIPLVWETIAKELKALHIPEVDKVLAALPAQFKDNAGISLEDVLGCLGGGYGVIFTLDESKQVTLPIPTSPMQIPDPGLAIFVKVKNDAIYTRIDQATTGLPMVAKMDENGMKTISLTFPIPLPVSLSPTLARSGDYLILASSDKLLQEIVAVQKGKKNGFKSTPEFKRLSQGIPDQGNNFSLVSEKFARSFTKSMQGVVGAQAAVLGSQAATLQAMMMNSNSAASYSVSLNGSEGWEAYGNGNKSVASAAVILPAAAAGGLLAAIAIPNFVRARSMAQANAGTASHNNTCISNLRMIDAAKGQWALEQHKQNTDTPTAEDIRPYMGRGPAGELPICPDDPAHSFATSYSINNAATKPTCKIEPATHSLP